MADTLVSKRIRVKLEDEITQCKSACVKLEVERQHALLAELTGETPTRSLASIDQDIALVTGKMRNRQQEWDRVTMFCIKQLTGRGGAE